MRARTGRVIRASAALLVLRAGILQADVPGGRSVPPDEDRFVNASLPNIALTTTAGAHVDLAGVASGRPLLFTFVFTRCAGVCSPFLTSWRAADRSLSASVAVHRLVLSFDPRDSVADMAVLAHHLDVQDDRTWTFAVAAPDDIRRLAAAVGFWYDWDPARQQFDHPAMLAAARGGRLVRLLVGGTVRSGRLDELVREVSGEFVQSYPLPGRVRFRCVQYDPRTGRVSLDWGFSLLLIPMGSVGLTTAILFMAGARVRRHQNTAPSS